MPTVKASVWGINYSGSPLRRSLLDFLLSLPAPQFRRVLSLLSFIILELFDRNWCLNPKFKNQWYVLLNIWVFYILCLVLKMLSLHCSTCSFCFLAFMILFWGQRYSGFFLSLLHSLVFCFRYIINVPQCLLACCVGLGAGSCFVYIKSCKLTESHFEILTHWFRLSREGWTSAFQKILSK